ncbi:hypothetical protein FHG87_006855 [Trinorchestia longiramus]|nr:hypothetical protein FHG87_006855 [Trinorchestia longiramus]
MVTLQVRLFALMVLGTIWTCEEVVGQQSYTYPVVIGDGVSSLFGSAESNVKTANVSFNKLKARGPDSDVVYQRVIVNEERLQYTPTMTVNLPRGNIGVCAQAAARKGLDAFVFNGSCTGYQLGAPFFKCNTDGVVIFVRPEKFADDAPSMSPDDVPYEMIALTIEGNPNIKGPIRQYMLSSINEAFLLPIYIKNYNPCCMNMVTLENGDTFVTQILPDLYSCSTDGDDGIPLLLSADFENYSTPVVYFLNECGNTIRIPKVIPFGMTVYSHEGFVCVDYPSEATDECTVTFESESPAGAIFYIYSSLPEREDGCTGFNMTVTGSTLHINETQTVNVCSDGFQISIGGFRTYTASLWQHPSKPTNGFQMGFYPIE